MISYVCKKCDDLQCETSVCPTCKSTTERLKSKVFWCNHCETPSFNERCDFCSTDCHEIGTDLRPVFPQERLLLEILQGEPFKFVNNKLWNVGANHYVIDGRKKSFSYKDMKNNNSSEEVIKQLNELAPKNIEHEINYLNSETIINFIKINRSRLNTITFEATEYIKDIAKGKQDDEMFVSFSGGKDSTVVSDLVINALPNKHIIHIYGDTTLEYPTTHEYLKRFRKTNPLIPVLTAKNKDQDFNNLCEVIGPPARMLRWCCTVFKTGAITKKIDSTFKDSKKIYTFQGIRRNESAARSKYDRESNESKIVKQYSIAPIIDWLDFDVWLYMLANKVDFNYAYNQGFSRVGCWCCPNNSGWSEYLSSIYMNEEYNVFRNILYSFAKKVGKPDWKEYIEDGQWKKRQGGNGLDISKKSIVSFAPCALEENTYNYELTKPITEDLYQYFIPFGKLNYDIGKKLLNEVYVMSRKDNTPILKLSGRLGQNTLKITVVGNSTLFSKKKTAEMYLKNQINKFQTCIGCTYCEAVCKFGAIKVLNTQKGNVSNESILYTLDQQKCVGCLECVTHFNNGCYINKVLKIKKD